MKHAKDVIFLVGGMTGGPIMPLLSFLQFLPEYEYMVVGVKGGFEQAVARKRGLKILFLPKAKQNIYNTRGVFVLAKIVEILRYGKIALQLLVSIGQATHYLLQYRPKAVVTAGGFLTVPLHFALKIVKLFGIRPRFIVHQQDVVPTKSNMIAAESADLLSVVWDKTKKNKKFARAIVVPNLLETERFNEEHIASAKQKLKYEDKELFTFLYSDTSTQPLLFVYGGGSGAQYINEFVWEYQNSLLKKFRILHITGIGKEGGRMKEKNYLQRQQLIGEAQDLALVCSDTIISRAGMGAITEIAYLDKASFLLPIPFSHQLDNAEAIASQKIQILFTDTFEYKKQSKLHREWVESIVHSKPSSSRIQVNYTEELIGYFDSVRRLLSSK